MDGTPRWRFYGAPIKPVNVHFGMNLAYVEDLWLWPVFPPDLYARILEWRRRPRPVMPILLWILNNLLKWRRHRLTYAVAALALYGGAAHAQWLITPPNGMTISSPSVNGQGQLQFSITGAPVTLPVRQYVFGAGLVAIDAGFGCTQDNSAHPVELYPISGGDGQVWLWDGSTLQSRGIAGGSAYCGAAPAVPGSYLADQSGNAVLVSSGDTMTIQTSGAGYTIRDQVTMLYLDGTGGQGATGLAFSTTPFVWTAH